MSEARRIGETALEPRAKTLGRPTSEAWRLELAAWGEEDRFAWTERVAIMVLDAGLSVEDAEHVAFLDVSRRRNR